VTWSYTLYIRYTVGRGEGERCHIYIESICIARTQRRWEREGWRDATQYTQCSLSGDGREGGITCTYRVYVLHAVKRGERGLYSIHSTCFRESGGRALSHVGFPLPPPHTPPFGGVDLFVWWGLFRWRSV